MAALVGTAANAPLVDLKCAAKVYLASPWERQVRKLIFVGAVFCAGVLVTSAGASVPPSSWRPASYVGPGILCGAGFTFELAASEIATGGFPSEGYVPITIKSHGGAFSIISHFFNAPELEKSKISSGPTGSAYVVKKVVRDFASGVERRQMYWFEPTVGTPFSVTFYAAVPGLSGWSEFPASDYNEVLRRVKFASESQQKDCLPPKQN
jgi:hypothetical protein